MVWSYRVNTRRFGPSRDAIGAPQRAVPSVAFRWPAAVLLSAVENAAETPLNAEPTALQIF